jgi:hypothetical protein
MGKKSGSATLWSRQTDHCRSAQPTASSAEGPSASSPAGRQPLAAASGRPITRGLSDPDMAPQPRPDPLTPAISKSSRQDNSIRTETTFSEPEIRIRDQSFRIPASEISKQDTSRCNWFFIFQPFRRSEQLWPKPGLLQ